MQDGPFPTFPAYTRQSSRKARAFLFVALFIGVIAIAILGGNFFLSSSGENEQKIVTLQPTPTPKSEEREEASPTATLTPVDEVDKSELSIQALNGSGTGGAAGTLSDVLKKAGYTVSATGNADKFDYTETVIQIKKSKSSYTKGLVTDLAKEYAVSSETEELAESARYDAIVIVGEN